MANRKITVDQLGTAISEILEQYEGELLQNLPEITKEVGKKGVTALKNSTRQNVNGSKYWKGWKAESERNRFGASVTIHNSRLPGLTHLLEHGHASRNGGRVSGKVHIAPVEKKLIEEYERKIEHDIKANS